MSFIKNNEDFICDVCGVLNKGNGYTNHCYSCLYGKHVDISPGDRLNECRGLMKPIYVSYTNKDKYIVHQCVKCLFEIKNSLSKNDSIDAMVKIQKKLFDDM